MWELTSASEYLATIGFYCIVTVKLYRTVSVLWMSRNWWNFSFGSTIPLLWSKVFWFVFAFPLQTDQMAFLKRLNIVTSLKKKQTPTQQWWRHQPVWSGECQQAVWLVCSGRRAAGRRQVLRQLKAYEIKWLYLGALIAVRSHPGFKVF